MVQQLRLFRYAISAIIYVDAGVEFSVANRLFESGCYLSVIFVIIKSVHSFALQYFTCFKSENLKFLQGSHE